MDGKALIALRRKELEKALATLAVAQANAAASQAALSTMERALAPKSTPAPLSAVS